MKKEYFTAPNLNKIYWLKHGFFTRNGGFSNGIFETLNCGHNSSDIKSNVSNNKKATLNYLDINNYKLFVANQVHGNKPEIVTKQSKDYISADALITKETGIAIGILTADCAPLLIVDSNKKIIANVHCGWKGTLNGIIENTLEKMINLGSSKNDLITTIGPCISPGSYEVKNDFLRNFEKIERNIDNFFIFSKEKKIFFNLPKYICSRLLQNGIKNTHIIDIDTYANEKSFFSYRRSIHKNESDYGRQLNIISISK